MLNPGVLLDAIVSMYRDIPELAAELGGAENIFPFYGQLANASDLYKAIWELPRPRLMFAWQGYAPGGARYGGVWRQSITGIMKLPATSLADSPEAHYRAPWLLVNGVPTSLAPRRALYAEVHSAYLPMDVPTCRRQTIAIDDRGTVIEYWEFLTSFPEKNDA